MEEEEIDPKQVLGLIGLKGYQAASTASFKGVFELLAKEARKFNGGNAKLTAIKLGGYLEDGERHGGYEYHEESREEDGQGVLIQTYKVEKEKIDIYSRFKDSVTIDIDVYFLSDGIIRLVILREDYHDGYLGIDNHRGESVRWTLLADIKVNYAYLCI